jgi:hypothetical protein
VSRKHRDQEKRRDADMRMAGFGMPVIEPDDPVAAERIRLLAWAWPLVEGEQDAVLGDDGIWHMRLKGEFRSAAAWQQQRRDLCYGKGRNCLTTADGDTTCVEVEVARRFAGWDGGWWNNYERESAPARWAQQEARKGELRRIVAATPLEPLFRPQKGIADVVVWRRADAGLEVVAVECKCLSPKDPISEEQEDWMSRFAAVAGRERCAFADWVRTTG